MENTKFIEDVLNLFINFFANNFTKHLLLDDKMIDKPNFI